MYKYETHLHTYPVSRCAHADVRENLEFYKSLGYDGVFITNHFIDGNCNVDRALPYEAQIACYFSDYEDGKAMEAEIGIKVFCGVETTYKGTDFLIYGLDKAWFLSHPEIMEMSPSEVLACYMEHGALVMQAHPYREAAYIDHIRLFPRCVHGAEILNAGRTPFENEMARMYAESYGLLPFAGSDNHVGKKQKKLAGMCAETPVESVQDFIRRVQSGEMQIFSFGVTEGVLEEI